MIPSLAAAERAACLDRAIGSVVGQSGVTAAPLVIVNGPHPDPGVLAALERDPRIRLLRLAPASLPAALRLGRSSVDTEFFAELDDDDLLLPGALEARVACLEATPGADIVVTNGFRRQSEGDLLHRPDFADVRPDPLAALLSGNWLLPGSWLCRTDRVGPDLFDTMPQYLECTFLAVKFSLTGRVTFLDRPTVVWNAGGGVSRSADFDFGQPAALISILELPLPRRFRAGLKRHLAQSYHSVSERYRRDGRLREAWKAHLASLGLASGWRYLVATRHLLLDTARRIAGAR